MIPSLPSFKRGDTFALVCTYKVNEVPTPITSISIRSQLRMRNRTLVADLTAIPADQNLNPGRFTLTPDTDTENWPLDNLLCDIELTQAGTIRSSQTFVLPVVRDITLPAAT